MLLPILAVVIGLIILIYSADMFIDGAVAIAIKYHMPKMLIGALIIGVGTSTPEIVVSSLSALAVAVQGLRSVMLLAQISSISCWCWASPHSSHPSSSKNKS